MRSTALLSLVAALACTARDTPKDASDTAAPAPTAAALTLAQFQHLRWLQGTWRGTGEGTTPFFESYLFLDDSTIRTFAYADSTLAQANDSGLIRWAGGEVRSVSSDMEWLVTEFDTTHVRFEPVRTATNSFTWTPTSLTEWRVTLQGSGTGAAAQGRVYLMQRVGS